MFKRLIIGVLPALLAPFLLACGPQPFCDTPGCGSWSLTAGQALTLGDTGVLRVRFGDPTMSGLSTPGHVPITLRLFSVADPPLATNLVFVQTADPTTYEYDLGPGELDQSWQGEAHLQFPDNVGEHNVYAPAFLSVEIKKPVQFAAVPIVYTDTDPAHPIGFPFPLRVLPAQWQNPITSANENIVLSLQRGTDTGVEKRRIKVLQFSGGKLIFDSTRMPTGYESELNYASTLKPPNLSFGEFLPTLVSAGNSILLSAILTDPGFGVLGCDPNNSDSSNCTQLVAPPAPPGGSNLLPPDTRALVGMQVAAGTLMAQADNAGKLYTMLLSPTGTISQTGWLNVANTPPIDPTGMRVFLSIGTLNKQGTQALLAAYQDPGTQLLRSVTLYELDSQGNAGPADTSNLSFLLMNQRAEAIGIGDLDGDLPMDIVFAVDGVLHFLVNIGDSQFQTAPLEIILPAPPGGNAVSSIALGDMNGDGKSDVIVSQELAKQVLIYLNQS